MLNLGLVWHVQHPGLSIVYSGHVQNTTVARISPSGYYCASADVVGTGMSTPRIREPVLLDSQDMGYRRTRSDAKGRVQGHLWEDASLDANA